MASPLQCRQQMIEDGAELIPRSCPGCKMGPCRKRWTEAEHADVLTNQLTLAYVSSMTNAQIAQLNYLAKVGAAYIDGETPES